MSIRRWDLPPSWRWVAAREIAEIVGGSTPPAGDPSNFDECGTPWITPADLTGYGETYIERGRRNLSEKGLAICGSRVMPAGAVLFSSRAPIGYCAIARNPISTNQGFKSLVLQGKNSSEFIRYYLLSAKEYAESLASGTTFKELSGARMAELAVPLPPIEQQHHIVAKLDNLFVRSRAAREELEHVPRLIERYKQAVVDAAFRGELTTEWRAKHGGLAWENLTGGNLFTWTSGKFLPKKSQNPGIVPVFGGNGVNGSHSVPLVTHSTLVVGRVGALCGNVYLTPGPAWITDNAIYAKTVSPKVSVHYARLVLSSVNLNSLAGGTGQPYVNQSTLNAVEFKLPSLEEQQEIIRRVDSAFASIQILEAEQNRAFDLLDRLEKATLAKAFRGELISEASMLATA